MSKLKVGVFSGHCQLKSGQYTGASDDINETIENERVAKSVDKWLKIGGADSDLFIIPRKHLSSKSQEDDYKLPKANGGNYDLIVEIHFNAFKDTNNPMGTECFYNSNGGKVYAQRINDRLDDVFKDRQVKYNNTWYMLTKTKPKAVLIEVCFCDSEADVSLYRKYGADYIGKLIAEGILNKEINEPVIENNVFFRVLVGSYNNKDYAINQQKKLKEKGFESSIVKYVKE